VRRKPLAVRAARLALLHSAGLPLADGLAVEAEQFLAVMRTDDAVESAAAFAQKRPPDYHGRAEWQPAVRA